MTIDQAKEQLIKRYKYLYENALFILSPFMYEQTIEELKAYNKKAKKQYGKYHEERTEPLIYLNIPNNILPVFEEFLLSDCEMEASQLYLMTEENRNNKTYLEKVKRGCQLVEKNNENKPYLKTALDIWNILRKTYDYIKEQSGDLKNKDNKLHIIDEYYRILRYQNDGQIRTSGRTLNLHDFGSVSIPMHQSAPSRDKKDIGIKKNSFISTLTRIPKYEDNGSIFLESVKQKIYLEYHDELPWNLEITCDTLEKYEDDLQDSRLIRPKSTSNCGKSFYINEAEIFVDFNDKRYRYYQLCPHCGYIVNIPKEILTDGIKIRIEARCKKDINLFRKMTLYSELKQLDDIPIEGQRKILKK